MKTRLSKHLRRTSVFFNALGTISIILSMVMAFFPQTGALARPLAAKGSIWTTLSSCGTPEQNINEFFTGDNVFINGANFDPSTSYAWSITGQPHSGDPSTQVAGGSWTTLADGSFCFSAYTIEPGDWGVYKYNFGGKNDNYHVTAAGVGSIDVTKDASPTSVPETGGNVTYTVTVSNPDAAITLTIDSLIDDIFGDLSTSGTCGALIGQVVNPGANLSCTFTEWLAGEEGTSHTNTVTVNGTDANTNPLTASDPATVTFTDVLPDITVAKSAAPTSVWEPGDTVSFTVTVTNNTLEALTLDSLVDNVFGNLSGQGSCSTPAALPAGGPAYVCTFPGDVLGQPADSPHVDVVTATASDNDGNSDVATDDASVTIMDIQPAITVEKTANPTTAPETGANVTYSVTVTNTSLEDLTLTSLTDSIYPDISPCTTGATLTAAGGTYTCSFVKFVSGNAGDIVTDVVTAVAEDDDGNSATDNDDAAVTILDVGPIVDIIKEANPTSVPETGGTVTYTITITNIGDVDLVVVSLEDDMFGNLFNEGDCDSVFNGTLLTPGQWDTCSFDMPMSGLVGDSHTNVATVTAIDQDETQATDSDDATVTYTDVTPVIEVIKTAAPTSVPESGGAVTFTFRVNNLSTIPVSLEVLDDTIFGDMNGTGTCSLNQSLAPIGDPADFYECTHTTWISGEPGVPHINVVTATAYDVQRNSSTDSDDATVTFENELPNIEVIKIATPSSIPETGGDVVFDVTVINWSSEPVTLDTLDDDIFGPLSAWGDCSVPQLLQASGDTGDTYSCSFTDWLSGEAGGSHTDTVTASAYDNEGSRDTDTDPATVTYTDVLPYILVDKVASPTLVPETGGDVTYTVTVTNDVAEALTLVSLIDDIYGDLNGDGDCSVPQPLAPVGDPGDSYSCSFTEWVDGPAGGSVTDIVEAEAQDNDGNSAISSDDAVVDITDVVPNISVEKTASPSAVPEAGGDVTFTITVTNTGPVTLWLTSLIDTDFGDLNGVGTCDLSLYPEIAPGGTYVCSFTEFLTDALENPHENLVTATGEDADDNEVTDEDPATVEFIDILPLIEVGKSASTAFVYTPGGNVTFTVTISNQTVEPVTIDTLVDSVFGDLNGQGDCTVPQNLAGDGDPGDTYVCSFTAYVGGGPGAVHNNVVTASGYDDEQNPVSDDGQVFIRVLAIVTPPPFIPVTGVDLGASELPFGPFGFASLGILFFGLGFVTKGYAKQREEDES